MIHLVAVGGATLRPISPKLLIELFSSRPSYRVFE